MSDVNTIDRVATDLTALRKAAREGRRAFAVSKDSVFVKAMKGAMSSYLKARREGVSREDGIKGLELELRDAWPKSVSKFVPVCESCADTGWTEHTCWSDQRCGRKWCAAALSSFEHLYVEPCGCANGDRMRKKIRTTEDAIAAAGRTTKRKARGFQQIGT